MRFTVHLCAILILVFSTELASSQPVKKVEQIEGAWRQWMQSNDISRSAIAIVYKGKIVNVAHMGVRNGSRFPIASLSKAITGACVQDLIARKKLSEETKVLEVIPDLAGKGSGSNVTIGQLLSQASGLSPDSTQSDMGKWLNSKKPRNSDVTRKALARSKQGSRTGKYLYNNENYAILGAVIERVSGDSYENYCKAVVLKPAGVTSARMSSKWGAQSAWGGWEMSVEDFARFVARQYGKQSAYAEEPSRFANSSVGGGAKYGYGTLFRSSGGAYNFWHFGSHCYGRSGVAGSFFASWKGEWAVVTAYNSCLQYNQMNSLDGTLARSALN